MKKLFYCLLVLIATCAIVYAADAKVEIAGNIAPGYIPDDPGIDLPDKDVIIDDTGTDKSGMKIAARVITSDEVENPSVDAWPAADYKSFTGGTVSLTNAEVDLSHDDDSKTVESVIIAYAAFGNSPSTNVSLTFSATTSEGWESDNSTTLPVMTVKSIPVEANNHYSVTVYNTNQGFSVTPKAAGAVTDAQFIGYTAITWAMPDGVTVLAPGDYTADVVITVVENN